MARLGALLSVAFLLCLARLSACHPSSDFPRTLPEDVEGRRAASLASKLNVHRVAHEDYDLDDFTSSDEEEDDAAEGDIDSEIDRLSDAIQQNEMDAEEAADALGGQEQEMDFAHKDADDETFMHALESGNLDELDTDTGADEIDLSSLASQDEDDDSVEEEEEDNELDRFSLRNNDALDFMSQADQEFENIAHEPIVAEEQSQNDAQMRSFSPKDV